ncbi:MAG: F0F1 ATP synthase subunit B', partial [Ensifer adhaerens]
DLAAAKSKGHKIADDARESAKAKANADRTAVEADLAKKISAAEDRIADIKAKALADVGAIAEETATAVVKQLIGGTVTKAEITAAVKASAGN